MLLLGARNPEPKFLFAVAMAITILNPISFFATERANQTQFDARLYSSGFVGRFITTLKLSSGTGHADAPALAVGLQGVPVSVLWHDYTDEMMKFSYSTDGGSSFSPGLNLTPSTVSEMHFLGSSSDMAIDDHGNIDLVWTDARRGRPEIYFATVGIKQPTELIFRPKNVRVNDDTLSAQTLHRDLALIPLATPGCGGIACAEPLVGVVWSDNRNFGNWDIWYSRGMVSGPVFWANIRVNDDNTSAPQFEPDIAYGNNQTYVVWSDWRENNASQIYFARSNDFGRSFSVNRRISSGAGHCRTPSIAVDRTGAIYVVWAQNNGDFDIFISCSRDGGETFSPALRVNSEAVGEQINPEIAIDSMNNLHIVWESVPENELRYTCANSTLAFAQSVTVSTLRIDAEKQQFSNPKIAVDNAGNPYVVWIDYEPGGETGIYFSTSINTPGLSIELSAVQQQVQVGKRAMISGTVRNRTMVLTDVKLNATLKSEKHSRPEQLSTTTDSAGRFELVFQPDMEDYYELEITAMWRNLRTHTKITFTAVEERTKDLIVATIILFTGIVAALWILIHFKSKLRTKKK